MKISHFLITVLIVTLASLFYVWQNVRQVELSYQLLSQEKQLAKLTQYNQELRYELLRLKAPGEIESRLLAKGVKLNYTRPNLVTQLNNDTLSITAKYSKQPNFWQKVARVLSGIFTLRSQLEAKP